MIAFDFQPIILVGAGRSGTNMLRDMLTRLPSVTTWPCDEINAIWRNGNSAVPHDELTSSEHLRPRVRAAIRHAFVRQAQVTQCSHLVEKTCANSLRMAFVDRAIPEAKFIFIVRDGRDVVASALKRWKAPLDLPYIFRKARYVPWTDLPYMAGRYALNRVHRLISGEGRLSCWGPRFVGMPRMLRELALPEVCAWQWKYCVDKSRDYLAQLPTDRVHWTTYEQLCNNAELEFAKLTAFLGIPMDPQDVKPIVGTVRRENSGVWRRQWDAPTIALLEGIMADTLSSFGYALSDVNKVLRRSA